MRHKINLPDQPNAVFLIIVFDIFVLVAVYGIYGSNWVGQAGEEIALPTSDSAPLSISENHIIVKVFPGTRRKYIVGKKAVPYEELPTELKRVQEELGIEEVLLMMDIGATIEQERAIFSIIQDLGMRCSIVAEPR